MSGIKKTIANAPARRVIYSPHTFVPEDHGPKSTGRGCRYCGRLESVHRPKEGK